MESRLFLETNVLHGRTNIKDIYFTSPYKIMSPFVDGSHIEVMQMSASAGLLSGDTFLLDLKVGDYSDMTYTSQSYEKVFRTKGKKAEKKVTIEVGANAKLKYMPYPVIPFAQSDFKGENTIWLKSSSDFLYCDIFTCGRTGMGEYFQMKQYESRTKIYVEKELVFADHTMLDPEKFQYQTMGMWQNFTHNGMLYIYLARQEKEEELIEEIRKIGTMEDGQTGVTKCQKGIVVRTLAMSGDSIYQMFQKIAELI